ncbi:MAG: hypothetical protein HRU28_08135 [Rhizobiales bacterium]|nr:hypothetical protein [Hyphomicrobiales bacterium]
MNEADSNLQQTSLIANLAGEWPCVPFGNLNTALNLPDDWPNVKNNEIDQFPHGYGANNVWKINKISQNIIEASIEYPKNHPIKKLVRRIELGLENNIINFQLDIFSKQKTEIPFAIHPTFNIDNNSSASYKLEIDDDVRAWTYPVDLEANQSLFKPNQQNVSIKAIQNNEGNIIDVMSLPFSTESEDLLMLVNVKGKIGPINTVEKYKIELKWDNNILPNCVLWYSQGGRKYPPWNGRNFALGIEPCAAAFDLGKSISCSNQTPLANAGIKTTITLSPEQAFSFKYSIEITQL